MAFTSAGTAADYSGGGVQPASVRGRENVALAGLSGGRLVMVWQETSGSAVDSAVRARIFNANGTPASDTFTVDDATTTFQGVPAVTALAGGGFAVAWQGNDESYPTSLSWRTYGATGLPDGPAAVVASGNFTEDVQLTTLSTGWVVAAWSQYDFGPGSADDPVLARLLPPPGSGLPAGPVFALNGSTATVQSEPSVTALAGGGFVAVWYDARAAPSDIHARIFSAAGVPLGADFSVSTDPLNVDFAADVTALTNGNFVVTWNSGYDGSSVGRVFSATGQPIGTEFVVGSGVLNQDVVALSDGRFVVAMERGPGPTEAGSFVPHSISLRVFAADGTIAGSEVVLATGAGEYSTGGYSTGPGVTWNNVSDPDITVMTDGRFAVAWTTTSGATSTPTFSSVSAQIFLPGEQSGNTANDVLVGGDFVDVLVGNDGDDRLFGGAGGDTLLGGTGNDHLWSGSGADSIDGGAGFDLLRFDYAPPTGGGGGGAAGAAAAGMPGIYFDMESPAANTGEAGRKVSIVNIEGVVSSEHDDRGYGDSKENQLWGRGGDDRLDGRAGNDLIAGEDGNDVTVGGAGSDWLYGGAGDDWIYADAADYAIEGGAGYDRLIVDPLIGGGLAGMTVDLSAYSFEAAYGSNGNDIFNGRVTADSQWLDGGAGLDLLIGGLAGDTVIGGLGADQLYGLGGADALYGDNGDDGLWGGLGADALNGGAGFDLARYDGAIEAVWAKLYDRLLNRGEAVGDSYDSIEGLVGSAFNDHLGGNSGGNQLWGGRGDDWMEGREGSDLLAGEAGGDTLIGGAGSDWLYGGDGDDWLYADGTDYALDGGSGYDRLFIDGSGPAVLDLVAAGIEAAWGGAAADIFNGSATFAALYLDGGAGADILYGGGGTDQIYGGLGSDQLFGLGGNDVLFASVQGGGLGENNLLVGGSGTDWLYGSAGAETFRLYGAWDLDYIYGFQSGIDRLNVQSLGAASVNQLGLSYSGGNTTITFAGNTAVAFGATLTATDFSFG